MKTGRKQKLTFGEFIVTVYDASGSRRARKIVQHAVNAHWLEFRRQKRFLVS